MLQLVNAHRINHARPARVEINYNNLRAKNGNSIIFYINY